MVPNPTWAEIWLSTEREKKKTGSAIGDGHGSGAYRSVVCPLSSFTTPIDALTTHLFISLLEPVGEVPGSLVMLSTAAVSVTPSDSAPTVVPTAPSSTGTIGPRNIELH